MNKAKNFSSKSLIYCSNEKNLCIIEKTYFYNFF